MDKPARMKAALGLLAIVFFAAACVTAGTTVTITSPENGITIERNKDVSIAVTATDSIGVTRVELWVAGAPIMTSRSTVPEGQTVFVVNFLWTPKDNGTHVLVVKGYNRDSDTKESDLKVLTINVVDAITPTVTVTPSLSPTAGITPTPTRTSTPGPSPTPTASATLTISPTPTTPPTGTPPPPPSAPSGLIATSTGTTIQFSWVDNSNTELGFRIYEQGFVAPVADNIAAHVGTGGMTFELKSLPCNTSAAFTVKAFNSQGESPASNAVNAITVPCAPTNLSLSAASSTSVNLSFQNNSSTETGYRVYQTNSPTPLGSITAPPGPGTKSGSVSGIPCGTTYAYFVRAFNAAGESSNSNTAEVTTSGCTVTITFTNIHVINGGDNVVPAGCGTIVNRLDCGAKGDIWLDFTVNTQTKRWPSSGNLEINNGETKTLDGIAFTFNLVRGQNLTLYVNATDKDSITGDDALGSVTKTYQGAENWGAGSHTEKPACSNPGGCYEITYTVEVKP